MFYLVRSIRATCSFIDNDGNRCLHNGSGYVEYKYQSKVIYSSDRRASMDAKEDGASWQTELSTPDISGIHMIDKNMYGKNVTPLLGNCANICLIMTIKRSNFCSENKVLKANFSSFYLPKKAIFHILYVNQIFTKYFLLAYS